ncbi:MAG: S1 family peptidase [Bdellovibrio sp.]|nr:S1 family peptidase [Bdellovibrio sp.]
MNLKYLLSFGLLIQLTSCAPSLDKSGFSVNEDALKEMNVIDGEIVIERKTKAARSVIAVELIDKDRKVITYCTGVLIGANTILTAAHCFNDQLVPGVTGFNVVFETRTKFMKEPVRRIGFEYVQHPQFNTATREWVLEDGKYIDPKLHPEFKTNRVKIFAGLQNDHDFAVGVFKGSIPQGFETVEIDQDANANYAGKSIYFYGYGRAVDYLDTNGKYDTSTGQLRKGTATIDVDYPNTEDRYFTSRKSKNSLCQGDSGGPQFFNEGGVLKVIGINSAVSVDEDSKRVDPSIASGDMISCRGRSQVAKVSAYADWILKVQARLIKDLKESK